MNPEERQGFRDQEPQEIRAWYRHSEEASALREALREQAERLAAQSVEAPVPRHRLVLPAFALAALLLGWFLLRRTGPQDVPPPAPPPLVARPKTPPAALEAPSPPQAGTQEPTPPAASESRSAPPPITTDLAPPPAIAELDSEGALLSFQPAAGISAMLKGRLSREKEGAQPVWQLSGWLEMDLVPGTLSGLSIETETALLRVLGTRFTMDTSDGTKVAVQRGRVSLSCKAGWSVELAAGQEHRCPGATAEALLIHARRLQGQRAPWSQVLTVAEAGLAEPVDQPALRDSLRVIRIDCLLELARYEEAQDAAAAYLASGATTWRQHVQEAAARARSEAADPTDDDALEVTP